MINNYINIDNMYVKNSPPYSSKIAPQEKP